MSQPTVKIKKMDYYVMRNQIIRDMIIRGVITDSDSDWETMDVILGENLPVDWES